MSSLPHPYYNHGMPTVAPPHDPVVRNRRGVRGLAVAQIVLGAILVILEIAGLGMSLAMFDLMTLTGAGIWNGAIFLATGILGVVATRPNPLNQPRKGAFVAVLVMSIISCIFAAGMFSFAIPAILIGKNFRYRAPYDYNSGSTSRMYPHFNNEAFLALRIIAIVLYFTQLVLFILTASFGCCNVCCSTPTIIQTVVYHHGPGQQGSGAQHQLQMHYPGQPLPQQQFQPQPYVTTSVVGAPPMYAQLQTYNSSSQQDQDKQRLI